MKQAKGWKEIPEAGLIVEAGNAREYNTGSWRAFRPIRDKEKCIDCLICWIYCPDSSIIVKDDKIAEIDLDHCKGCGICAKECPKDAIKMVPEGQIKQEK